MITTLETRKQIGSGYYSSKLVPFTTLKAHLPILLCRMEVDLMKGEQNVDRKTIGRYCIDPHSLVRTGGKCGCRSASAGGNSAYWYDTEHYDKNRREWSHHGPRHTRG